VNGRVFKTVYNNQKMTRIDLQNESNEKLVELQMHRNDFHVRHARRILQERGANAEVHKKLKEIARNNPDETRQLRGLWALHVTKGLDEGFGQELLGSKSEFVRAWTIQCLAEDKNLGEKTLAKLAEMSRGDKSPLVRLYLAAAMQRVEPAKRWEVLRGLLSHAEDATDHNLPLMYWYATEGAVAADAKRGLELLKESKIPLLRQYITRRLASGGKAVAQN
jgi:hypothetical protein